MFGVMVDMVDIGGIRCIKKVTIHTASILSIDAGEHWLGVGAADFHRPQERLGGFSSAGSKMAGLQLYRTPQKTAAMVCFFVPILNLFMSPNLYVFFASLIPF